MKPLTISWDQHFNYNKVVVHELSAAVIVQTSEAVWQSVTRTMSFSRASPSWQLSAETQRRLESDA